MNKRAIIQAAAYNYGRPYQASYQVVRGIKMASMTHNWCRHINSNYHGWEFDLRNLKPADVVDFRLTSEEGVWEGRIPRHRMPAMFISFGATEAGYLKPTGRYAKFFRKVG